MNDKQLELFIDLADIGSFSKAEDLLYMTKQGMYKTIANLEEELGFQLFTRTKKGILLTEEGKQFYHGAKELLNQKNHLIVSILKEKKENVLRIGNAPHQVLLRDVNAQFSQQYPDILLQHVVHPNNSGEYRVEHDIQDVAESFLWDPSIELSYEFTPLLESPYVVIMDPNHPLASHESLSIKDLKDYHLTYFSMMMSNEYNNALQSIYQDCPDLLEDSHDVDNQIGIIFNVQGTQNLAIEANPVVHQQTTLKTIPLVEGWSRTYGIIYRANPNFITQLYIDLAIQHFRSL